MAKESNKDLATLQKENDELQKRVNDLERKFANLERSHLSIIDRINKLLQSFRSSKAVINSLQHGLTAVQNTVRKIS